MSHGLGTATFAAATVDCDRQVPPVDAALPQRPTVAGHGPAIGLRLRQMQVAAALLMLASFQYGYHIGELNSPKDAITQCPSPDGSPAHATPSLSSISQTLTVDSLVNYVRWAPGSCVPMTDNEYSYVTAALTLGGLTGSFVASHWASRWTRQKSLRWGLVCLALGGIWSSLSDGAGGMAFGRWLAGFGSAVAIIIVPLWLTELAPVELRGLMGMMNQLGIVIGTLSAQILGLFLSRPFVWRYILLIPGLISILQMLLLRFCPETRPLTSESDPNNEVHQQPPLQSPLPRGSRRQRRPYRRRRSETNEPSDAVADADVDTEDAATTSDCRSPRVPRSPPLPTRRLKLSMLARRPYLRSTLAVLLCAVGQQISGINAVMYYSTPILSPVAASQAPFVTVYISIGNLLVTLLTARFVDRFGKRSLLLTSILGMSITSLLLALAIANRWVVMSAVMIILVVATFGIGLGPIPFLVAPDLFPPELAGQAQSVGMAANWMANLVVAAYFLPLQRLMGGWVFAVFSGILLCLGAAVLVMFARDDGFRRSEQGALLAGSTISSTSSSGDTLVAGHVGRAASDGAGTSSTMNTPLEQHRPSISTHGSRMRLRGVSDVGWQPLADEHEWDDTS